MKLKAPSFCLRYKGHKGHKLYQQEMERVEAHRSELVSDLALFAEIKFAEAVQWVADQMRPGQTFDEALYVLHKYNRGTFATESR